MSSAVVTVDGPAGSGKTTLGRRLALALDVPLIDTGLFYRGVMVAAVRADIDETEPEILARLAETTLIEINTDPRAADGSWQLRVDGHDAGAVARDPRHAHLLTTLAQIAGVRTALLDAQRRHVGPRGAVAVGRDCGSVIFPDATVKFFLEASSEVRTERRAEQLRESGEEVSGTLLQSEVADRDRNDSPAMIPASGAIFIDSEKLGIEEMVAEALKHCAAHGLQVVHSAH